MLPKFNPQWVLKTRPSELSDPKYKKLVCIGDSITHGLVSADYPAKLRNKLRNANPPFYIINAGHNSDLAHHVRKRINDVVILQPDYITILIGSNDANNSFSIANWIRGIILDGIHFKPTLQKYRADLTAILEILKTQTHAKIAILSIPPISQELEHPIESHVLKCQAIIQELAAQFNIAYLPLHEQFIEKLTEFRRRDGPNQLKPKLQYKHWQSSVFRGFYQIFIKKKSWNQISHKFGLYLHTDLLHLNDSGADIIIELIESFIQQNIE